MMMYVSVCEYLVLLPARIANGYSYRCFPDPIAMR